LAAKKVRSIAMKKARKSPALSGDQFQRPRAIT
jgi:hypothetical protein